MSAYSGKYKDELIKNAAYLGTPGKGILAADESSGTIGKGFASINIENVEDNHRALCELLFCTPGALQYISSVILFEETLYQSTKGGKPFIEVLKDANVLAGIKVDKGTVELGGTNGETTTQGHDDLDKRCAKYYQAGARFAKWRAVLKIGPSEPSQLSIDQNAQGLARYAIICQENGLVPIVEPEILVDGPHDIDRCAYVTEVVLAACYKALNDQHVLLEGTLLMPNMVTPGSDAKKVAPEVIAEYTVRTLQRTAPPAVPAIVFLFGGQSEEEATKNLNAMNKLLTKKPWSLSFSFGCALQQSTLMAWDGKEVNLEKVQKAFLVRCKANSEATLGTYQGDATLGDGTSMSTLHVKDYKLLEVNSMRMPDWSTVPADIVGTIISKLVIRDYIRFRAVCTSWNRVCSCKAVSIVPRLDLWLMLPTNKLDAEFFSIHERKIESISLMSSGSIVGSSHGWLVFHNLEQGGTMQLVNPISCAQFQLPPFGYESFSKAVLLDISENNYSVAVIFDKRKGYNVTHKGINSWLFVDSEHSLIDVFQHRDQIYTVDMYGTVKVSAEVSAEPPSAWLDADGPLVNADQKFQRLVETPAGDLLKVKRQSAGEFAVWIMKKETYSFQSTNSIGDFALFVSRHSTFCFLAKDFPNIKANCVYYINYYDDLCVFNLKHGTKELVEAFETPMSRPRHNFFFWFVPSFK